MTADLPTVALSIQQVNGARLSEMGEDLADGLFSTGTKRNTPAGRRNAS